MSTIEDYPNNPFFVPNYGVPEGEITTWFSEDIAGTKVLNKIRKEIARCEFKLKHLPIMFDEEEKARFIADMNLSLELWNYRLDQARYN